MRYIRETGKDGGFVLVAALWAMLLVAVLLLVALRISSDALQRRANVEMRIGALAQADAALYMVLGRIVNESDSLNWPADGTIFPVRLPDGQRADVSIEDELAKVDLNAASHDVIRRIFEAVGVSERTASHLADALADWRDADNLRRLNGAEAEDYARAGLGVRPRNGDFESVDELGMVMGITPEIMEAVRPHFTVYSQTSLVNERMASQVIRDALGLADREASRNEGAGEALLRNYPSVEGRAFTICAKVFLQEREFSRSAVIRLTGSQQRPFMTYIWREGWDCQFRRSN